MLIKHIPEDERPREKLFDRGPSALSDSEILALFFSTGRAGVSAIELGREMISRFGSLRNLSRASIQELQQIPGIGPAKAAQLSAVFEFGRRLAHEPFSDRSITSPEDVFALVGPEMQMLAQESVRVILLNHRKRLIHLGEVFRGTGNESFANPSEILRKAISHGANSIVLVHNHPSGDPSPSNADHEVTRRLKTACLAIGVEFTDHIIVGCQSRHAGDPYFSFREAGLI
ncbi:MAG: DNA repair protein RadC [Verrucomicrobiales bacterium]|nr:DNA repair protein RadC [Verrucomicrobiales bacterium]